MQRHSPSNISGSASTAANLALRTPLMYTLLESDAFNHVLK
jgi:hypothetical protein